MKEKLFLSVILGLTLSVTSCSEDVAESQSGTKTLRILVDDETKQAQTRAAYAGLETTFEAGDAIGLYAVDGATATFSNVKFTYDGEQWTAESNIPYNANYTYYAYYPYTEEPEAPAFTAGTDENTAFASMIDSWEVSDDQGTLDNFRKNDLMLAKGADQGECTIAFTMLHKMALAVIDGSETVTFSYADNPEVKTAVMVNYAGKVPYYYKGENKYYFFMRPNTVTVIGGQKVQAGSGKYAEVSRGDITENYTLSYDGEPTPPEWLTVTKSEADGAVNFVVTATGGKTDKVNTTTEAKTVTYSDANLKAATPVSDYDLSMHNNDGTARSGMTTANCYMVHAPGTYKLPLVYGNAFKDGSTNEQAYKATASGDNIKPNLVNHADQDITDPWIKNHSITVDGAELVWQDAQDLVTNIGISGDYLTFTIDRDNITAGNAVVAAKANDVIVWSWHIWVTEETFSDLVEVPTSGYTYKVTPYNIGWVPLSGESIVTTTTYAGNTCQVELTFDGGTTMTFDVVQPDFVEEDSSGNVVYKAGYAPYYQWGRKDAMIPSNGTGNTNHAIDYGPGETFDMLSGANSVGTTIQHPVKFSYYEDNFSPYKELMYNYWDINQNVTNDGSTMQKQTQKTVYDPCPPGFCVPTAGLYDKTSTTVWDGANKGRTWTVNGSALWFPASGRREYTISGRLYLVGDVGYYWTASVNNKYTNNVHNLYCNSDSWFLPTNTLRIWGNSVRAVAED